MGIKSILWILAILKGVYGVMGASYSNACKTSLLNGELQKTPWYLTTHIFIPPITE